jgi:phytoene/squalene synthetase
MIDLYHKTSYKISKSVAHAYSTSFSWGIEAFAEKYKAAIYSVYAYVRLADEIVDSFHGYNKKELLEKFRADTYDAFKNGISVNPVIHAFQKTALLYNIDMIYIDAFLDSMAMDLDNSFYKRKSYDEYIFGSAEAVGLMCLKVFCEGSEERFKELLPSAKALGSAFQKVNFLRDIKSDIEERGRIYLPDTDKTDLINNANKKLLEFEIELEFKEALNGIRKLPAGAKTGVYSAYLYYYALFRKIKSSDVSELLNRRVRVSNFVKFLLLLKSLVDVKLLNIVEA